MQIREINTSSYVTRSKLPDADYVINPYVGCLHKCIYCYAEYMKRFTGHSQEEWGNFLDIKQSKNAIDVTAFSEADTILLGSVTDAYNPFEKKYEITRKILEQLISCTARIEILTKSDLVLRDIGLFKEMKNVYVGVSMNTTDDGFRKEIEPHASSVEKRIETLKELHQNGINTYLFMSPIFPDLSDYENVITRTQKYVKYICFENLNLRGSYLPRVMEYIKMFHPDKYDLFKTIYWSKNMEYWEALKAGISSFCQKLGVEYRFYFYHNKMKKE